MGTIDERVQLIVCRGQVLQRKIKGSPLPARTAREGVDATVSPADFEVDGEAPDDDVIVAGD